MTLTLLVDFIDGGEVIYVSQQHRGFDNCRKHPKSDEEEEDATLKWSGQIIIIRFFFTIVKTTSSSFKDFAHIHKSLQEESPNVIFLFCFLILLMNGHFVSMDHLSGLSLDASFHQLSTCRIHSHLSRDVHSTIYQDSLAGREKRNRTQRAQILG